MHSYYAQTIQFLVSGEGMSLKTVQGPSRCWFRLFALQAARVLFVICESHCVRQSISVRLQIPACSAARPRR